MQTFHRKVCSSHALFPACAEHSALGAAQHLSGVILLNSPTTTDAEMHEYLRLWSLHRQGNDTAAEGIPQDQQRPCCYFVCGDGGFRRLRRFVSGLAAKSPDAKWLLQNPLCDAVIGDMDSLSAELSYTNRPDFTLNPEQLADQAVDSDTPAGAELPGPSVMSYLSFDGVLYDTVDDIPVTCLDAMHARAIAAASQGKNPEAESPLTPTPLFPVACQMSTDFGKCVALLQRLRHRFPNDFEETVTRSIQRNYVNATPQNTSGSSVSVMEEALPSESAFLRVASDMMADHITALSRIGSDPAQSEDARQDAIRERTLLQSFSTRHASSAAPPTAADPSSPVESSAGTTAGQVFEMVTHVLPNVAVFGALGGRLDHELGALNTILMFATEFHLMLLNANNVVFACWPNGVTVWLPMAFPAGTARGADRGEGPICGLIPFGPVTELETAGFVYDMVKGRDASTPGFQAHPRFDGVTQTSGLTFAFGALISACNTVDAPVVAVDLRRLAAGETATGTPAPENPPTILTCNRA